MKYWDLTKELKEGKLRRAYLFYGDDEGFVTSLVKDIVKISKIDQNDFFNYIRIDGHVASLDEITNAVSTLPVMNDKKYVEIFRADFLTGTKSIKDSNEKIKFVQSIFENPPEDMVFVIYYNYENGQDKSDAKVKNIEKNCDSKNTAIVKLPSLSKDIGKNNSVRNEIILETINRVFLENKLTVPKFVYPYVKETFDSNVDQLEQDLIKIINYSYGREVTKNDFEKLLTKTGNMHVFNLTTLIFNGKTKDAIELYNELIPKIKSSSDILGPIGAKLREAYIYKVAITKTNGNIKEIMKIVDSKFEWLVNLRVNEYKTISIERLNKMFKYLVDFEVKVKSYSSNVQSDLEMLIILLSSTR